MSLLWALLLPMAPQEPGEDLKKEVERLRQENQELRRRAAEQDKAAQDHAYEIIRLQQAIKLLKEQAAADTVKKPFVNPTIDRLPGPITPIKGKLVFVNSELGFVTIGIGKAAGVQVGYRFEILRETFEQGADLPRITKLGVGEVEKFMGGQETMSKLKILEGNAKEMRPEDLAVAIRGLAPVAPPKDPAEPPPTPPDPSRAGVFAITGQTGTSFLLDYGSLQGARQTAIVFAYSKDGTLKARLRLDKVDKSYSVANLIPGSQVQGVPPPERGDLIYTRELAKGLTGKVSFLKPADGTVAVDLRPRDGAKPGQRYEIRRGGEKVGTLVLTDVQDWGSWAKPDPETPFDRIQKGDFVEVVEEK